MKKDIYKENLLIRIIWDNFAPANAGTENPVKNNNL